MQPREREDSVEYRFGWPANAEGGGFGHGRLDGDAEELREEEEQGEVPLGFGDEGGTGGAGEAACGVEEAGEEEGGEGVDCGGGCFSVREEVGVPLEKRRGGGEAYAEGLVPEGTPDAGEAAGGEGAERAEGGGVEEEVSVEEGGGEVVEELVEGEVEY